VEGWGFDNLILTGFMGTGKSSVGRALAERLGWELVDFDAELEQRFGRPVARIFAEEGEAAFRAAEAELCRGLTPGTGLVVATGGGTAVDPANRTELEARGVLVCLTAEPGVLLERLRAAGTTTRPLLDGDAEGAIRRLLAARAPAYEAIRLRVDTTGLDVDSVADRVLRLYRSEVGDGYAQSH